MWRVPSANTCDTIKFEEKKENEIKMNWITKFLIYLNLLKYSVSDAKCSYEEI